MHGDAGYVKGDELPASEGCGSCTCEQAEGSADAGKVRYDLSACQQRDADADAGDADQ